MRLDITHYSVTQLTKILGCSRSNIYVLEKSGELPARVLIGKTWKWRSDDIDKYIESRRNISAPKRRIGKPKLSVSKFQSDTVNKQTPIKKNTIKTNLVSSIQFNSPKLSCGTKESK